MIGKGLAGLASIIGGLSLPSNNVPSDNVNPVMTQEDASNTALKDILSKIYSEEKEAPLPKVKPPVPNDLDVALSIAEEKGKGTPSDIYDKVLKPIAYHESDKTMNPKLEQYDGGPGRGLMQFEPDSMKTALNRAKRIFGNNPPSWIQKAIDDKNYDASTLTADQQMALAVYDLLQKPKADISKVTKGKQSIEDFWAKYWWAGKEKDKKARLKVFKKNLNSLNNNKKQGGSIVERNPYNYQLKAI